MRLLFLMIFGGMFAYATELAAAPRAELWERWTAYDPESAAQIDHGAWDRFLDGYLIEGADGINRIRYAAVTAADRAALDGYIDSLERVAVSTLNRAEQFAYWVNFYNALTVRTILEHYPVESIRDIDISPGLFANGPWGAKLVSVEGERLSLDDIEHRILRPIWQDPRIHYAVNCAALGCPNLQSRAFTAANTDALLDAGAKAFINHPRGFALVARDRLQASSIYDWFQDDFGASEAEILEHARSHGSAELRAALQDRTEIDRFAYDWSLNVAP